METVERRLSLFGYASPIVALGSISLAALVDPQFVWETRSLSSIGEATGRSFFALGSPDQIAFVLFNGGLLFGALLGLPFAYGLWKAYEERVMVYGHAWLVVTLVSLGGVGVAYLKGPNAEFHFLFASLLFFSLTFTVWLFGTGKVLIGRVRNGLLSIWLGNLHAFIWIVWIILEAMVFTNDGAWTWFAVPEYLGAVMFVGWMIVQARRLRLDQL